MHYLVALAVPIVVFAMCRSRISSTRVGLKFAFASAAGMYLVTVATAFVISAVLECRLAEFDLNHDGVFSPDEQTPAQVAVMDEVVNDAGRNLSVFFAIPWSIVSSFGLFVPAGILRSRGRTK